MWQSSYIIIKVWWQHGFPCHMHSLTIHPYSRSLLGSRLNSIRYLHRADKVFVGRSMVVCTSPWREGRLYVHPYLLSISCLWESKKVTVQLLFCGVLFPGFVPNSSQYACVVLIVLFRDSLKFKCSYGLEVRVDMSVRIIVRHKIMPMKQPPLPAMDRMLRCKIFLRRLSWTPAVLKINWSPLTFPPWRCIK